MKFLSVLVLCLLSLFFGGCHKAPKPKSIAPQISIQQKAAHLISFKGRNADDDIGFCTGTVVGHHAIMTADHCDIGAGQMSDSLSLDLAVNVYHIQKRWNDGRDHIIYGLDGPAFEDIIEVHQRDAKIGESVYYYGDPQADFPQHHYIGKVASKPADVSEVDRKAGIAYFDIDSLPGCSGSAIYGADGYIVGLVTYGDIELTAQGIKRSAIGFSPNFSPKDLKEAINFKPSKHPKVKEKDPEIPRLFPF